MKSQHASAGELALIALREQDRERGLNPSAPSRVIETEPPAAPGPSIFEIMQANPPNWRQELAERERQEREEAVRERTELAQAALEPLAEAERPTPPKPRWRAEQMRASA